MKARASLGRASRANMPSQPPLDWVWGGLGVGAATMSSAFAAYMLTFGPPQPRPGATPDFGVFATVRPRTHTAASRSPSEPQRTETLARTDEGRDETPPTTAANVDFAPTGSVSGASAPDGRTARDSQSLSSPSALPGFVVRDVFDGKALVESRSVLSLVAPGSALEGAGEVLSIERRGDHWIVATTRGIIGASSR